VQHLGLALSVGVSAAMLLGVGAVRCQTSIAPTGINGVINVQAYGALGDGQTDDTKAIQMALSAASGTGATVMLPPTEKIYGWSPAS
jgi:polygalacturonase